MNLDSYKFTAHRGLFNNKDIPENSMKAFEAAMQKGFAIELDVQMTKDGYLVVFHDKSLKRVCGIKNEIPMLTLNEVKQARLCGTESMIPTFEDVLMLVGGRVPLLIEVKTLDKNNHFLEKLVELLNNYKGLFAIQSINPYVIDWFYENKKKYPIGLIIFNDINYKMFKKYVKKIDFISVYKRSLPFKSNKMIIGWTIKNMFKVHIHSKI